MSFLTTFPLSPATPPYPLLNSPSPCSSANWNEAAPHAPALSATRRAEDLKRRKAQGSQTTIQQSLIDINVVRQQLPKDTPKIAQIVAQVKGFKQTDAAENFQAFRLRQLARPVIVEQHRIGTELFRQQNCAHLDRTQTVSSLGRMKTGWILNCPHFNPFRLRHLRCSGQASASDDNFVVNLRGDTNTWEDSVEEVKAAKLGQNDERR